MILHISPTIISNFVFSHFFVELGLSIFWCSKEWNLVPIRQCDTNFFSRTEYLIVENPAADHYPVFQERTFYSGNPTKVKVTWDRVQGFIYNLYIYIFSWSLGPLSNIQPKNKSHIFDGEAKQIYKPESIDIHIPNYFWDLGFSNNFMVRHSQLFNLLGMLPLFFLSIWLTCTLLKFVFI